MRRMRRGALMTWLAAGIMTAVLVPPASSTPGLGITAVVEAHGKAVNKVMTRGNQAYDVIVQELTFAPGGHTGWHSHPGQVIVVVESGTFTTYRAVRGGDDDDDNGDDDDKARCEKRVYHAGQVYVDPGYGNVHIARNESSTDTLVVTATFLDVPVGGAFRNDAAKPRACSRIS